MWLGVFVQPYRILDADDGPIFHRCHQEAVQPADSREVPGAYGGQSKRQDLTGTKVLHRPSLLLPSGNSTLEVGDVISHLLEGVGG